MRKFEQAWQQVVARHAILRSSFVWEGFDKPIQIVHPQVQIGLEIHDLKEKTIEERDAYIVQLLKADLAKGFELAKAPLMRLTLLEIEQYHYKFVWTHHHLLLDGWSLSLILREVFGLYDAFCKGREFILAESGEFKQYIAWLQEQDVERAKAFWTNYLAGFTRPNSLGYDKLASGKLDGQANYQERKHQLSATLTQSVEKFARENLVTLNSLFQGIWSLLLSKYSGETDIVFGTTVSGRPTELTGVESIVGLFINVLPTRIQVDAAARVSNWLREIQTRQAELRMYEYTPQIQIQGWSEIPYDHKLFESIMVFENYPLDQAVFEFIKPLTIGNVQLNGHTTYPLHVRVVPGNQLSIDIIFDEQRFEQDVVDQIFAHMEGVLQQILSSPDARVGQLTLSTQTRGGVVNQIRPDKDFEKFSLEGISATIPARFEQIVSKHGAKIAVRSKNYRWTYEQVNQLANGIAQHLVGTTAERVGLFCEHDAPLAVLILGILKAGKTYVPLDPTYPEELLSYILQDSAVTAILTNDLNLEQARRLAKDKLPVYSMDALSAEQANPGIEIAPDSPAYILYTSGTTGQPKGVVQTHENLLTHIQNYTNNLHINYDDTLTLFSSYGFDASLMDIWGALLNGATLAPYDIKKEGIVDLAKWMVREEVTVYHSTPTVYRYFVSTLQEGERLENVRIIVLGGEEVVKKDVELYKHHFPENCLLVNGLGPTESTLALQNFINHTTEIRTNSVAVGYPVSGIEIILLDHDDNPTEIFGEIGIKSKQVAWGYWQKPELTAKAFVPVPEAPEKRLYKTGDLGLRLPDGSLLFVGRKDSQVKIRGYRIELSGIEAVISGYGLVKEAVVIAREIQPGEKGLIAFVVPKEGSNLTVEEITKEVQAKLPSYMVPAAFVLLDKMPLTPTGKINRRLLAQTEVKIEQTRKEYAPPQNELENLLVQIWQEVLHIEKVGIHDNFFELGGHLCSWLKYMHA